MVLLPILLPFSLLTIAYCLVNLFIYILNAAHPPGPPTHRVPSSHPPFSSERVEPLLGIHPTLAHQVYAGLGISLPTEASDGCCLNYGVLLGLDFRKLHVDGTSRPDGTCEPKVFTQWRRVS